MEGPAEKLYTRVLLMVDKPPISDLGPPHGGGTAPTQRRGRDRFTVLKGIITTWQTNVNDGGT